MDLKLHSLVILCLGVLIAISPCTVQAQAQKVKEFDSAEEAQEYVKNFPIGCKNPWQHVICCEDNGKCSVWKIDKSITNTSEWCAENAGSDSGSLIDNSRMSHLHFADDFMFNPASSCTSCSVDAGQGYALPELFITRVHRYREIHYNGSFGPGVFSNYDVMLELLNNGMKVFDPASLITHWTPENTANGNYDNRTRHKAFANVTLYDAADQSTTDHSLAIKGTLKRHDGIMYHFEIINTRTEADPRYWGRLVKIEDRNGNASTITYEYARGLSDAALGNDRLKLWKKNTVTDAYGRVATFHYDGTTVSGVHVVTKISVPVGAVTQDITYEYNLSELGHPQEHPTYQIKGLSKVNFPDGTASSFGTYFEPNSQCQVLQYFEAAADSTHRNKQVYLTLDNFIDDNDTPSDTSDDVVIDIAARLIRMVVNGESEVAYLNWDNGGETHYIYEGAGQLKRYSFSGDYAQSSAFAKDFDLNADPSTYIWEETETYQNDYNRRITRKTDANGNQTSRTVRDSDGATTSKTYADGTSYSRSYNGFQQVTQHTDRIGRITDITYDANGNMLTRTVAVGTADQATWSYTYFNGTDGAPAGLMKTSTDAIGNTTNYEYTTEGYLAKVIQPADDLGGARAETLYAYDASGRLTSSTDPEGRVTTFAYDVRNRQTQVTYNDGSTETIAYGAAGSGDENLPVSRSDRNGNTTQTEYDAHGRVTKVTQAFGESIAIESIYEYQNGTNRVITTTVAGNRTETVLDYKHRAIEQKIFPNATTILISKTVFDDADNVLYSEDPYGRRSYTVYDALYYTPKTIVETVPDAVTSALGLPSGSTPTQAQLATLTRDNSPNAKYLITESEWDDDRQLVASIDARGLRSEYDYDFQGRTIRTRMAVGTPDQIQTETVYDAQGNVIESRNPRYFAESNTGHRTVYTYTGRNLTKTVTVAPGTADEATTSQTYYLDGRARTFIDGNGNTWVQHWHQCCGRFQASVDPLANSGTTGTGPGRISNTDFYGNVTHSATVENLPFTPSDGAPTNPAVYTWHDPIDADTINEATMRYDARNRVTHSTTWLVPLGYVDDDARPNLPGGGNIPIAGLDGVPHSNTSGLTTRYIYDDNASDGLGIDAAFPTLLTGLNLDDSVGAGGSAVMVINPEGERSISISDAMGRTLKIVVLDTRTPLAAAGDGSGLDPLATPGAVLTQATYAYDQIETITGYGDVVKTTVTDAEGSSNHSYTDAAGRTIQTEDALGKFATATYDNNGNVLSSRDANNVGQDCIYDSLNRDISCTDTQGDVTSRTYNANSQVITSTDAKAKITTIAYDLRGRTTSTTDRISAVTIYSYDDNNNTLSITDGENKTTAYTYDTRNLLIETTYADHIPGSNPGDADYGNKVFTYDGARRKLTYLNQANETISFSYDMANRLLTRSYPDSLNDTFSYDLASRIKLADSARYDNEVTFTYDEAGRKTFELLQVYGNTYLIGYSYNLDNTLATITYPDGRVLTRTYTTRNQIETQTFDSTLVSTNSYDDGMRKASTTHGNGVVTNRAYRNDNLLSSIDHVGVTTINYNWDANKNKTSETYTGGLATAGAGTSGFSFDDADRLTGQTRNDGFTQSYNLTQVGNMSSVTTTTGSGGVAVTQTRTHNNTHEFTGFTEGSTTNSLAYDTKGNLTKNPMPGREAAYTWDYDNRLRFANPAKLDTHAPGSGGTSKGLVFHDPMDANIGQRSFDTSAESLAGAGDFKEEATYTNNGKLGSAITFGKDVASDGGGQQAYLHYPDTDHLQLTGDMSASMWIKPKSWPGSYKASAMIFMGQFGETAETNANYAFGMMNQQRIYYIHEDAVGVNTLLTWSNTGVTLNQWNHLAFTRDTTAKTVTLYVNGVLVSTQSYTNNPTGGTAGDLYIGRSEGATHKTSLDGEIDEVQIYDRVITAAELNELHLFPEKSKQANFTYDALGRRITKESGNRLTLYVCSGGQVLSEYEGYNPGSASLLSKIAFLQAGSNEPKDYVYCDYIDCVCAMIDPEGDSPGDHKFIYYHANQQYSVVALSDEAGATVELYKYSAHGEPTILDATGTTTLTASTVGNSYTYTGRRTDAETGLLFMRNRYHDAMLQRFISRDPAGYVDGWNLYRDYFSVDGVDPWGNYALPPDIYGDSEFCFNKEKDCEPINIEIEIESDWKYYRRGRNSIRGGFYITSTFTVKGNPKKCSYFQVETGGFLKFALKKVKDQTFQQQQGELKWIHGVTGIRNTIYNSTSATNRMLTWDTDSETNITTAVFKDNLGLDRSKLEEKNRAFYVHAYLDAYVEVKSSRKINKKIRRKFKLDSIGEVGMRWKNPNDSREGKEYYINTIKHSSSVSENIETTTRNGKWD